MRDRLFPLLLALLAVGVLAGAAPVPAQAPAAGATAATGQAAATGEAGDAEPKEERPETPEERFARLTSPGEHHEHLGRQEGDWVAELRIWTAPGTEPIVTAAVIESRWILGGHFLETRLRGELFGEPFEAKGVDGYDNHAEKYVGTWRDNLGTLTLVFRGTCKDDGTERTLIADLTDPISGKALKNKGVTTFSIEEDSYTYESFLVAPDGTEFQNLEITARREAATE